MESPHWSNSCFSHISSGLDTPQTQRQTPPETEADTPWTQRQTPPPRGRHPHPEVKTGLIPPGSRGRQPPPPVETAYEAGGTHPTGCILVLTNNNMFLATIIASINFEIHNYVDTLYFLKYPTTMFNQFCIAVMVDSRVL